MSLEPGQTIAHYRLVEKIGEGGMGIVWKALDTKLNRHVALKVLPPDLTADSERLLRFRREAQAAAALDHPSIAVIYEVGDQADCPYIAMQLLEGRTLREVMDDKPLPLEKWLKLVLPIADGLSHAHKNGIVHRDLKPGNVIVTNDGHVKILDFGLAKVLDTGKPEGEADVELETRLQTISRELTQQGTVVGTVAYMSPEQARGKNIDHRSDIFSFGVMLYQMVTGRLPFHGDSDVEALSATLTQEPAPPSQTVGALPPDAERVIRKSLEKDPDSRYQHADDLATDLRNLRRDLDSGKATMPSSTTSSVASSPPAATGGNRGLIIAAAAVVIIALGVTGWLQLRPSVDTTAGPATGVPGNAVTPTADTPSQKKIVVLPFQNLGSPDDEYFAAGITEEIISRLATLDSLGVISRGSAFQYDRSGKSMKQIGTDFGVDFILDGTIRWARSSDSTSRVRITPQLIQAGDDTQIWSDSFDEVIDDIFQIQSEIAGKVAGQLGMALGDTTAATRTDKPPTENPTAYQAYLRGRHHSAWGIDASNESFRQAIQLFKRAIELDSEFVLAHSWLSRQHSAMVHWGHDRSDERRKMARAAAERALALAPESPESHLAMGYYHYWGLKDYEPALAEFDIALAGMPNNSELHESIAYVQRRQGRFEEAIASLRKAAVLDPLNHRIFTSLGETLAYQRRYTEAIQAADQAKALAPDSGGANGLRSLVFVLNGGAPSEILRAVDDSPGFKDSWMSMFALFRMVGDHQAALETARGLSGPDSDVGSLRPASLYEAWSLEILGRQEEAADAYRRSREFCEQMLERTPDDFRLYSALGLSLAGLGEADAAIAAGQRATVLYPVSADALAGYMPLNDLALIYTHLGIHDQALNLIDRLLSMPSLLSVSLLEVDPSWAPLRSHPRYRVIVQKYTI